MVAAEYDGGQHQTDRYQYLKDLRVIPRLERMGRTVLRVVKEQSDGEILVQAYRALVAHGWDGKLRKPHPSVARLVASGDLSFGGRTTAVNVVDYVMRIRKPEPKVAMLLVSDLVERDPRLFLNEDIVEFVGDGFDSRLLGAS